MNRKQVYRVRKTIGRTYVHLGFGNDEYQEVKIKLLRVSFGISNGKISPYGELEGNDDCIYIIPLRNFDDELVLIKRWWEL